MDGVDGAAHAHAHAHPFIRFASLRFTLPRTFSWHRYASGWDAPTPFPEGDVALPETPLLDPSSAEAKEVCAPGTGWRHKLLLVSASSVAFGGYFAKTVLSAVSADVRACMW